MTDSSTVDHPATIRTVAAVIQNAHGQVLLVRKNNSDRFIQPGGKPEAGEDALTTLARELKEELNVQLIAESAHYLGEFEEWAVNETGRRVRAKAYWVQIEGEPDAQAEIAEARWLNPHDYAEVDSAQSELINRPDFIARRSGQKVSIAPLSAKHILPAFLRCMKSN